MKTLFNEESFMYVDKANFILKYKLKYKFVQFKRPVHKIVFHMYVPQIYKYSQYVLHTYFLVNIDNNSYTRTQL